MAKISNYYTSIYQQLQYLFGNGRISDDLSFDDDYPRNFEHLKGAFQPLADMWKDAADTFRPYRSTRSIRKNAAQPFYGFYNLFKGLAYLVLFIPLFFVNMCAYTNHLRWCSGGVLWALGKAFCISGTKSLSWLIDGILSIIRGITEIATTLLTWFIKMPMRYFIVPLFLDKKALCVEGRPSVQRLAEKAKRLNNCAIQVGNKEKLLSDFNGRNGNPESSDFEPYAVFGLIKEIHKKYKQKRESGINHETENTLFEEINKQHAWSGAKESLNCRSNYLRLFLPDPPTNPATVEEQIDQIKYVLQSIN